MTTNKPHWSYRHPIIYTTVIWTIASVGFIIEMFLLPFMVVTLAGETLLGKMNICYHPMKATKLLWNQVKDMRE